MLTDKEVEKLKKKYKSVKKNYDYINSFDKLNCDVEGVLNLQLAHDELYYITNVVFHSFKKKRILDREETKFFKNVNYNSNYEFNNYKNKIVEDFIKENKIPEISYDLLKLYENCGNLFN